MSKRALLFYPPMHCHKDFFSTWSYSHSNYFPIALLKLSTFLKKAGYHIDYLDCFNIFDYENHEYDSFFVEENITRYAPYGNYEEEKRTAPIYHIGYTYEEIKKRLCNLKYKPDEVYVSSLFTWSWQTTHNSIKIIKEVFPRSHVKLGGVYPTLCPELAATSGADEIVQGLTPEINDCWLDIDILKTLKNFKVGIFKTSIGCPNNCSYCAVDILEGTKLSYRNIDDLIDEICFLSSELGIQHFQFWDSNIIFKPEKHFYPLLEKMNKVNNNFHFYLSGGIQPNLVTPEIAVKLKTGGFSEILLTLETSDPERTKESNRPSGVTELDNAITHLINCGYCYDDLSASLLINQPGQTTETILLDILKVYQKNLSTALLVFAPIPGTADYINYKTVLSNKRLEDLDPLLYPFASPKLTTKQ
ncbi:MAG: radical SAM protein, partial [Spirochaetes bacterium]|nr:radical SAM protein [Spirochaetota bacterium]